MVYNRIMKYTVRQFSDKFRNLVGDSTIDSTNKFTINALNWAFNELPLAPKLDKIFSKNYRVTLKPNHYRYNLTNHKDFRRLTSVPAFQLFTSTGGDLCPLKVCAVSQEELRNKTIPGLNKPGRPCEYCIEQEDDELYLVFDRPVDVPVIIQYTAYGIPRNVTSPDDEVFISGIIENALLDIMRVIWYREADDLAFAGAAYDYLDNKYIPQITQIINKQMTGIEGPVILGV